MREMTVPAQDAQLAAVTDFVNETLEALDCPMKTTMQIDIALEEIFVNIAHYAYGEEIGTATVCTRELEGAHGIEITLSDSGMPYNPLAKEDPDITLSAEERDIGGLGVFMVKKIMDDVRYEYADGKNILTMRKTF